MNTNTHLKSATKDLSEAAGGISQEAKEAENNAADMIGNVARDVNDTATDAARSATKMAKDLLKSSKLKAEESIDCSVQYVRRNPVPVVLGAIAFGATLGYLVMMARRKPTFGERYSEEPMVAVREAILGAFAPMTQSVHRGYDSARDGAEKAMERVHRFSSGRSGNSISDQIGRFSNNLKFW